MLSFSESSYNMLNGEVKVYPVYDTVQVDDYI